ncbi:helix-turn-helix transcriptional regulator [Burkholderia contaminans]|nr:helix-turn-helix transcriptional regulator [Burkholderia contaminans]
MKWRDTGSSHCPITRAASIVGDRWTILILHTASEGCCRFEEFRSRVGLTRHLLADRLVRLVHAGMLFKVPYNHRPLRFEYRLTRKGEDFRAVLSALSEWGIRWMDDGPPPGAMR